jgi:hypothetical protein
MLRRWIAMWRRSAAAPARERAAMAAVRGLAPGDIARVTFLKADELCWDLVWCRVETRAGETFAVHEEQEGWAEAVARLEQLPGFRADWLDAVSRPPFERCETVAFSRGGASGPPG